MLDDNLFNDDGVIRDMSVRMKGKFDKYWKEYSVVLAFGAILDARLKLDFLNFCYAKLDPSTSQDKVKNVKDKLEKRYGEYASNFNPPSASHSHSSNESTMLHRTSGSGEGSRHKSSKVFSEYKMFQNETSSNIGKSELDLYLDEAQVDSDDNEDFDVLNYWKINEKRFPTLSIMARDVLSIPITTVASESAFSIGGRVLTKNRSSTIPENVQMLICTRNWLHGFVPNLNDEDDCKTSGLETSGVESNVLQGDHQIED